MFDLVLRVANKATKGIGDDQLRVPKSYQTCLLYYVYLDPSVPQTLRGKILVTLGYLAAGKQNEDAPDPDVAVALLNEMVRLAQPYIKLDHLLLALSAAGEVGADGR